MSSSFDILSSNTAEPAERSHFFQLYEEDCRTGLAPLPGETYSTSASSSSSSSSSEVLSSPSEKGR